LRRRVPPLSESAQGCGGAGGALLDAHMVDDEPRIGVVVDQRRARVDVAPEEDVDWEIVFDGRA